MNVFTQLDGLAEAELYFKTFPEQAAKSAQLAINQVLQRQGLRLLTNEMYDQIAFPKGYLKGDRIGVTKFAKANSLEGVITARGRATSLARFAAPGTAIGSRAQTGVTVQVRRGNKTYLRGAWLVRLNKGASLTQDNYNVGLAVRVKPGDRLRNKHGAHKSWLIKDRVALLYGPSVDQVFRDVAETSGDEILSMVSSEFLRQLNRLT